MPDFNVFDLLASGARHVAIHDVRLVDGQPAQGEHGSRLSRLIVERAGVPTGLVAGVSNGLPRPRADGCSSNGSDERDMAEDLFGLGEAAIAKQRQAAEEAS